MTGDEILDQIEILFPDAKCELLHDTPFQLLVAVVLSATNSWNGVSWSSSHFASGNRISI